MCRIVSPCCRQLRVCASWRLGGRVPDGSESMCTRHRPYGWPSAALVPECSSTERPATATAAENDRRSLRRDRQTPRELPGRTPRLRRAWRSDACMLCSGGKRERKKVNIKYISQWELARVVLYQEWAWERDESEKEWEREGEWKMQRNLRYIQQSNMLWMNVEKKETLRKEEKKFRARFNLKIPFVDIEILLSTEHRECENWVTHNTTQAKKSRETREKSITEKWKERSEKEREWWEGQRAAGEESTRLGGKRTYGARAQAEKEEKTADLTAVAHSMRCDVSSLLGRLFDREQQLSA